MRPLYIMENNGDILRLMHTLFALEDRYGLNVIEEKRKISLVLSESNLTLHATLEQALFE